MAKQYDIKEFFETDLPTYGAYDNTRKLACYVDGLKISMRKIIYTLIEKKYTKDKVKTETVANLCAAFTNYLHGSANLCGVCNTLAQSFVGANNYPLVNGNSGGFGTRINPDCAAPRYTKIALAEIVKKLINEDDYQLFEKQFFEGDYIEPKFFVPVFPLLFLNGSSGISTGFGQDIYPRNPTEVIEYIKKKIAGVEKPRMELLPWFKGHLGKVERNKETGAVESFGVLTKNNMTSYTVTELPIGVEPKKYCELLEKMCENGTIVDYDDKCDTKDDSILFEIKTTREFTKKHPAERKLYEVFRLIKTLPENYCCIDENYRVREFKRVQEILDAFIAFRLKFFDKRKKYILESLKSKISELVSKYTFVLGIVKKTIIVSNKKKDDIIKQIDPIDKIIKIDGSYDYLLRMPIHSLTTEKLAELKQQIMDTKAEFDKVKATTIQDMWLGDLHELKKVL